MKTLLLFVLSIVFSLSTMAQDIHEATRSGDVNKVYQCLQNGADIDAQDHLGRTPLMFASLMGNYKVAKYLIENKCEINKADFKGRTALDYSIRMKNIKLTALLQKNNATIGSGIHDSQNVKQPVKSGTSYTPPGNKVEKSTVKKPISSTPNTAKINKKEKQPQFPGGNAALHKYLRSSINYPDAAKTDSLEGTVHVKFEVTPKGEVTNIEVTRSDNEIFNEEAIRLVKNMPAWDVKGVNPNHKGNFEYRVPVHFKPDTSTSHTNETGFDSVG